MLYIEYITRSKRRRTRKRRRIMKKIKSLKIRYLNSTTNYYSHIMTYNNPAYGYIHKICLFLSQPHTSNKITIFNLKYKRFFNMPIEDLSKETLFLIYFLYIHTYNHFTTTFIELIKILNTNSVT